MTNQGPRRAAGDSEWSGRLTQAREFHESARSLVTLAQSKSYNGAITLMVTAAIGYSDAITAKRKGVVNKQDHQTAVRLMREALGNGLPDKQEKFFAACWAARTRSTTAHAARRWTKRIGCLPSWTTLRCGLRACSDAQP